MTIAVCVTFQVVTEHRKRFMELLLENSAISLAKEKDCLQFDICTDASRPNEVFLYEIYTSHEAFELHLKSKHFHIFNTETSTMIEDKEVKTYGAVN